MRFGVVAYTPKRIFYYNDISLMTKPTINTALLLRPLLALLLAAFSLTACNDDDADGSPQQGGPNLNANTVTDEPAVARLEFPRLKEGNNKVIVYRTSSSKYDPDRVNYAVEWDCDLKSQRWSCYQMHQGYTGSYSRVVDGYMNDTKNLAPGDYYETDYIYRSGFQHGHICPNADRKYTYDANYQTFYMTNMQPQYAQFNGYEGANEGLWLRLENKVRDWTPRSQHDTLYVCKGGTIDGEDKIISRLQGKLIVPRYFFMAILLKNSNGYRAIGFYMEQKQQWATNDNLTDYAVTIDQLEELTGIDFFCNLPDKTENDVESRYVPMLWGLD